LPQAGVASARCGQHSRRVCGMDHATGKKEMRAMTAACRENRSRSQPASISEQLHTHKECDPQPIHVLSVQVSETTFWVQVAPPHPHNTFAACLIVEAEAQLGHAAQVHPHLDCPDDLAPQHLAARVRLKRGHGTARHGQSRGLQTRWLFIIRQGYTRAHTKTGILRLSHVLQGNTSPNQGR
jgi:hypothetical protein